MQPNPPFDFDFGILPDGLYQKKYIESVTDLLLDKDAERLLRFCGIAKERFGKAASQYDKFCALCDAAVLAEGHPVIAWCQEVLARVFGISLPISGETCETIWRQSVIRLQEVPLTPEEALALLYSGSPARILSDATRSLPVTCIPVLDAASLTTAISAKDWGAWLCAAQEILDHFAEKGCDTVYLCLKEGFVFDAPNLYRVNQILNETDADRFTSSLWIAQLARLLSAECKRRDWSLCLRVLCDGEEACKLLAYLESSVGLARCVWSTSDPASEEALLRFQAKDHACELFWALWRADYPTTQSWRQAIKSCQERYPIGRLQILTVQNAYKTPFLQRNSKI